MISAQPNNWQPIWGWYRWNGNRAVRCWDAPDCPKPGLPEYALCYTWLLSWRRAAIRMSKPFMSGYSPVANPRCPPSVPPCASWYTCALAYSKPVSYTHLRAHETDSYLV